MRQDYEKLFFHLKATEPAVGLFDRIILAIQREQELRQTKKNLCSFLSLLIVSATAMPISAAMLAAQIEDSGIIHFLSAAIGDFGVSLALWKNFSLAIIESLPITGMMGFALSLAVSIFTLRLFLHKKLVIIKIINSKN